MNIKYNKKKEELRRDPVMEFLEKTKEFIIAYSNTILTILVVGALVFAGFQVFSYLKRNTLAKSQNDFGRAMIAYSENNTQEAMQAFEQVIENHKNTVHAAYSAFMLAQIYRVAEKYTDAIAMFNKAYANNKNSGFVKGESLEGLALCYEATGETEKALEYFEKALHDKSISYRYPAIRWKMALINKQLGNMEKATTFCNAIVSDTLAAEYKKKAENLLAAL
ncbi:MAG: tetratricopeptide repeat protein [archaeon]